MKRTAPLAVVSWSLLAVLAQPLGSASPAPVPQLSPALDFEVFKNGVYTTGQANAGKTAYLEKCASCHGTILSANELPAGNRALGEEVESLTQIRMDAGQP